MAISHHHEWYVTVYLAFSSLKIGKLTFTLRLLPGSPIGHPIPRRGWTTRGVSRKLWPSLPLAASTTLTSMLRMNMFSLRPVVNCITTSCLPFGSILFHASHPLFVITCSGWGTCYHCHSAGTSWPPCLCSLSTTASATVQWSSCTVLMVTSTWASLPAQLMGPIKLNPTSLTLPKGNPYLCDCCPKIGLPSQGQVLQL